MNVFKIWKDFESDGMNEKDLLQFAIELWTDGSLKIEQLMIDGKKVTRYSIKCWQDEKE
jgi:hypothetical protein